MFLESFAAVVERFERDGIVSARPELSRLRTTGLSAEGEESQVQVCSVSAGAGVRVDMDRNEQKMEQLYLLCACEI